jgi:hypothetical protein
MDSFTKSAKEFLHRKDVKTLAFRHISEAERTALLRFATLDLGVGVKVMRKHRKVNLLKIKRTTRIKLEWQIRRQVQQKILETKLTQCFLKPHTGHRSLRNYPESMQPMIADFMQKTKEQTELTYQET